MAVIAVYLASFASQMLLSPPVTAQAGVALFVLAQIALIWIWIVLHTRRLRDAGRMHRSSAVAMSQRRSSPTTALPPGSKWP